MDISARYHLGCDYSHTVMLGCLVSPAICEDKPPTHTSKPYRHVANRSILSDILAATDELGGLGMLHFELNKAWPGTKGDAQAVIALLQYLSQRNLRPPVQLNGVLFPDEVNEIHKETGSSLVLQFRQEFSQLPTQTLIAYIESVASSVAMILLDPSAGTGHAIDLGPALHTHQLLESHFPGHFSFGYAGGLGGISQEEKTHTTEVVRGIRAALGNGHFSVDSETRVRKPLAGASADILDLQRCEAYLSAVVAGL
jgi:hypothetical protein